MNQVLVENVGKRSRLVSLSIGLAAVLLAGCASTPAPPAAAQDSGIDVVQTTVPAASRPSPPTTTIETQPAPVPTTVAPQPTPSTTVPAPPPTVPAPTTTTTTVAAPTPPAPSGWTLYWSDEFDSTAVNSKNWRAYHNTYGDGNKELACLTPQNAVVSNGTVKLTAKRERKTCPSGSTRDFTSAFLGSRDVGRYFPAFAKFEMRAKLPHGQGLWPAFWLRHRNGAGVAEVDIMEYFHAEHPGKTRGSLHLDGRYNLVKKQVAFESPAGASGWHTWGVEVNPHPQGVEFVFLMDGKEYNRYVDTQHNWRSQAPDAATWDIAVNLAVGGTWTGHPDGKLGYLDLLNRCSLGGTAPNGCRTDGIQRWTGTTAEYEIDYVRVFTRNEF